MSLSLCVLLLLVFADDAKPAEDKKTAAPGEVETLDLDWKDSKRDRDVPVRLYFPKTGAGPFPVIVFSHGLGGSRSGYAYLGRHWASHGYVCVHMQHKGSDESVWKGSKQPLVDMRKAARDPSNILHRPLDVRFTIDQLTKLHKEGRLKGRLDLDKVGMAGHSFGAYTTLAAAGQVFATPLGAKSLAEPRIKAAIAMSPNAPPARSDLKKAFGSIKVPMYHLTGTRDDGVGITDAKASDRRVPYDNIKNAPQYLLVLKDGDHMVFAATRRLPGAGKKDARFHELIRMSTTAFWDAHLKGDKKALAWLRADFARILGSDGTFATSKPQK
jgi:predicted dienelactone hydrolase